MNESGQQPQRVGVRGALASPRSVLWARDQLAALLACAAVPRCGARSPASLVPHHVLACDVGQRFVTHVARTATVCGDNLVSASSANANDRGAGACGGAAARSGEAPPPDASLGVVCVGVSITLGVVECRGWARIQCPMSVYAWVGVCGSLPVGAKSDISVVDPAEMAVVGEVVDGMGIGPHGDAFLQICKGSKWAVLYNLFGHGDGGRIAVRPLGLNAANRVVDVRGCIEWGDMVADNEAALLTRIGDQSPVASSAKFQVLCVDLEKSYQSGQLAVTDSFDGSDSLRRMAFRSKSHKLIVPTKERRNNDGSWVLGLMSLRPLKVLRTCSSDLLFHKVDSTHFAEEDRTNRTLSVFSTDDFETPVCIFALDGKFKCGNGFIALVHPDEGCVDLVDAVTGTWLLRQPFLPHTHMESNRENVEPENNSEDLRKCHRKQAFQNKKTFWWDKLYTSIVNNTAAHLLRVTTNTAP
ncbi:hypothetical protein Pelo_16868 [Pelomyxa schiedti]|nr:hypothetical protein Pelo_16868 [Pelomyxa schiedti]